ncbi:hypothetical protein GCM10010343_34190 [Streptomyces avidinii]|uniref:Transposase of IS4/5 family DUF4096 n=1 Tax=Streptomyces avidinii TaxID=1895 RepID=A0ABS4LFQ9_STRAV|nr:hypothetical protein [Streptomyces avidinii]GGZ05592.1 hypothetical protein GCM10010343_34190 [Streptomyces avidinii]
MRFLAHVYGNAAGHPDRVRRYPAVMTDAKWAAVRPLLPVPAWFQGLVNDTPQAPLSLDGIGFGMSVEVRRLPFEPPPTLTNDRF